MPDVGLLVAPGEPAFYGSIMTESLPLSLALGTLQGHLVAQGLEVTAADLNEHMPRLLREHPPSRWLAVCDREAVLAKLRRGKPCGVEDLLDDLLASGGALEAPLLAVSSGGLMSMLEIHLALLLARHARDEYGRRTLLGGSNLDYLWQFRGAFTELWGAALEAVDAIVLGPGELALAEAAATIIRDPSGTLPAGLPGAVGRDGAGALQATPAPALFPRPDFSGLDLSRHTRCCPGASGSDRALAELYLWPTEFGSRASILNRRRLPAADRHEALLVPYVSSLGCNQRCAFCVQSADDRPRSVHKGPAAVVDDLAALSERYSTPYFFFLDTAFDCSSAALTAFANAVRERDLTLFWSDCARFEGITEEKVDLLYEAGCRKLVFGLDTASPGILELIGKRLDLDHARRVLRWCRERGLWADLEIIVGLPHESEDDFRLTYDFVADAIEEDLITGFHPNRFFVIPDSLFGSHPERYGIGLHLAGRPYETMLAQGERNLSILCGLVEPGEESRAAEFRILSHSETGGRGAQEVRDAAARRLEAVTGLRSTTAAARDFMSCWKTDGGGGIGARA